MERTAGTVGFRQATSPKRSRRGRQQVVVVEVADDLAGGAGAEEGVEDQRQAALDFPVRVLEDAVEWVTDQAGGEGQGQLTAAGLVEQSGGQACRGVCISSSEIKPLRPRIRRPLGVAGS